jgi:ParB/RepB/Spo0J family partition protein
MSDRGSAPESLLEELSLAEGEFSGFGQVETRREEGFRLERPHMPVLIKNISEESPYQNRVITFDPDKFPKDTELIESVKKHGVLEPIYLERLSTPLCESSQYRPIAGHRRLAAARLAGLTTIDAIIAKEEDDIQAFALAENLGHRELTSYEKALSLMALKGSDPRLSLRDLARRSGLPFGTVSSLVSAYEKSTPVLRRCFAEGMAPRAVQELQPLFEDFSDPTQMDVATLLRKASQPQATTFRQLVVRGVDPIAAAKSAIGFVERGDKQFDDSDQRPTSPAREKAKSRARKTKSKRSQGNKVLQRLPDPEDEETLLALSTRTGTSKSIARRLTRAALRMKTDYTTLTIACVHAAAGGEAKQSLELASKVAANRQIASLIRRHLDILERARGLISDEGDPDVAGFLQEIFFGA